MGIDADCKGKQGENFFCFFAKVGRNHADSFGMGKDAISAGFLTLACGDVIALSQFNLSLWEAAAFGALCVISCGLGLFAGLAE